MNAIRQRTLRENFTEENRENERQRQRTLRENFTEENRENERQRKRVFREKFVEESRERERQFCSQKLFIFLEEKLRKL